VSNSGEMDSTMLCPYSKILASLTSPSCGISTGVKLMSRSWILGEGQLSLKITDPTVSNGQKSVFVDVCHGSSSLSPVLVVVLDYAY
jgi:hypothetical protein